MKFLFLLVGILARFDWYQSGNSVVVVFGARDALSPLRSLFGLGKSRPYIQRLDDFQRASPNARGIKRRSGRKPIGSYEKLFAIRNSSENTTNISIIEGGALKADKQTRGGGDKLEGWWKRPRIVPVGNALPQILSESTSFPHLPPEPRIASSTVMMSKSNDKTSNQLITTMQSSSPAPPSARIGHRKKSFFQHYGIVLMVALTRTTTRVLHTIGKDWYTGYYLRTTLERVEHQYTKRYDVPACLRSVGRLVLHGSILVLLGTIMEWMVGLSNLPCRYVSGGGCHWWCGLLWLVAVTGPGHAAGVAVAIWVSGLRLQLAAEYSSQKRPSVRRIISRPGTLLRWIVDPDQWFRELLASRHAAEDPVHFALQPFDPDWRMFPATWSSLRVLQMIAIAKEMHGSDTIMHTFMRLVLVQQAFSDEWYRVLMCEKRVAWGIVVMVGYTISTASLFWNMIRKPAHIVSSLSILMTTPSVLAVVISFWMNVLVYFERRQNHMATQTSRLLSEQDDDKFTIIDPIQSAIQQYQKANLIPLISPQR